MNLTHIIERIVGITKEEEVWLRKAVEDGLSWQHYYKGEYALIRRDKLAQLTKNTRKTPKPDKTPIYCSTCATKLKTMPCDSELTYCPTCDLPHE